MKKIVLLIALSCFVSFSYAEDNTKVEDVDTGYTSQDNEGNTYPIYLTPDGRAYTYKMKDGKLIKKWLGSNVAEYINNNPKQIQHEED